MLGNALLNGEASRLYQALVKGKELMLQIRGGVNFPNGSPWRTNAPTLLALFGLYKPATSASAVVAAIQEEIQKVARAGVAPAELTRVKTKMWSDFYSSLELPVSRADALAIAQLFMGSAAALNDLPVQIDAVTSTDLQRVATRYLTVQNRTWVDRQAAAPTEARVE